MDSPVCVVIPVDVQAPLYLSNICDLSLTELNLQRLDNDLWHRLVVLEMVTSLVNLSDRKALKFVELKKIGESVKKMF